MAHLAMAFFEWPRDLRLDQNPATSRVWGDVILTEWVARAVIQLETELPQGEAEVWMTTSQMGHSLEREETELVDEKDDVEGKETTRFLDQKYQNSFAGRCGQG